MPRDPNDILAELDREFTKFTAAQTERVDEIVAELGKLAAAEAARKYPYVGQRATEAMAGLGQFAREGLPNAAMSIGSTSDGGVIIQPELDREIATRLAAINPMRALASVVSTVSSVYERVIATTAPGASWAAETAARTASTTPNLEKVGIAAHELYALAPATQALLEDAETDVAAFLVGQLAEKFAAAENTAFVAGSGSGQPRGFLAHTLSTSADGARAFGALQVVPSGDAATFGADALLRTLYTLRAPYRNNATWIMNSETALRVMGFKDAEGRFLWADGLAAGQPPLLLGRPVAIDENMPAVAANATPIAIGDWKTGYLIADRLGTQLLRDPYTNRPYVNFYARKRVGGAVVDDHAIKLLRISAS